MGEETRRDFLLASSVPVLLALQPNVAFGSPIDDVDPGGIANLDKLIDNLKFTQASDLSRVFTILWDWRKDLNLAKVEAEAQTALSTLVKEAQETLLKDYGGFNPLPHQKLQFFLAGTIFMQNSVFREATDVRSGVIKVTTVIVQSVKNYCSQYPYCK